MKVVLNKCYGGFSISKEAAQFMADRGNKHAKAELNDGERWYGYGYTKGFDSGYDRTDKDLVEAVEVLGEKANGDLASLCVVEIPDGIEYTIEEYDGIEWIAEVHRTWG